MYEQEPQETQPEDFSIYESARGEGADGATIATIHVDLNNSLIGLKDRAYGYLKQRPEIKKFAKENSKKMKAFVSGHGTAIAIGTAAATVGIFGAVELFKYRNHKRNSLKNPKGK
jgi:hypothetical protein